MAWGDIFPHPTWEVRTETGPYGGEWIPSQQLTKGGQIGSTAQIAPPPGRAAEFGQAELLGMLWNSLGRVPARAQATPAPVPGNWYQGRLEEPRFGLEAATRAYAAQASPYGRELLAQTNVQPIQPWMTEDEGWPNRPAGLYFPDRGLAAVDTSRYDYAQWQNSLRHEMTHAAQYTGGGPWAARSAPQQFQRDYFGAGERTIPGSSIWATSPYEQGAILSERPEQISSPLQRWYPQYDWNAIATSPYAEPQWGAWRPNPFRRVEHDPYSNEFAWYDRRVPYSAIPQPQSGWGSGPVPTPTGTPTPGAVG